MMNKKTLMTLGAVLVVLVALVVLKSAKQDEIPLEEAVELHTFVPADIEPAKIAKLELYAGAKPDDKVVLEREAPDSAEWRVASHYNAPVADTKISDFLTLLTKLSGESRERGASEESLAGYELKPDQAFHVAAYASEGEPLFDVLVGKQADFRQVFARPSDSTDVFVVDKNPRREAGLWSEDMAEAPEAQPWLDKEVVTVAQDTINSIEVSNPLKRVVFKKESPAAEPTEGAEPAEAGASQAAVETVAEAEGETVDETEAEPADEADAPGTESAEPSETPSPPEPKWTLAEGGYGTGFKQTGLDRLLRTLSPLNATDIVDSATPEAWGLTEPAFRITIGSTALEQPVVVEGGRPDPAGDGYVRVAGRENAPIYKLTKTSFEQLFAVGKTLDLFDLPTATITENDVQRIEIVQPDLTIDLVRGPDKTWTVAAPATSLTTLQTAVAAIAGGLASWTPADVASAETDTGLAAPSRTVRAHMADGAVHTYLFGNDCPVLDGVYVRVDDQPNPVVMARADVNKILAKTSDLFELTVMDIEEAQIGTVAIELPGVSYTLTRGEGGAFTLTAPDGASRPASESAVNTLLTAISDLKASDVTFGQSGLGEPTDSAVRVTTLTGVQHELLIGARRESNCRGYVTGKDVVFALDNLDVADLLPAAEEVAPVQEPTGPETAPASAAAPAAGEAPGGTPADVPAAATETPAAETPAADAATVPAVEESAPAVAAPEAPATETPAPAQTESPSEPVQPSEPAAQEAPAASAVGASSDPDADAVAEPAPTEEQAPDAEAPAGGQ